MVAARHAHTHLCALTADDDDALAGSGHWLKIPVSVLPDDSEAVIVQQHCKLIGEGETHRNPCDLGLMLVARPPAPVSRPVQDLGDRIIGLGLRNMHLTPAAVGVGLPMLFGKARLEESK